MTTLGDQRFRRDAAAATRPHDQHVRAPHSGRSPELRGALPGRRLTIPREATDHPVVEWRHERRAPKAVERVDPVRKHHVKGGQEVEPTRRPRVLGLDPISLPRHVPAGPNVRSAVDSDEASGTLSDAAERCPGPVVARRALQRGQSVAQEAVEDRPAGFGVVGTTLEPEPRAGGFYHSRTGGHARPGYLEGRRLVRIPELRSLARAP